MADDEHTTIITPRLRIVPFGEEHCGEHYLAWLNDPDLMAFSEQRHRRHTLESCRAYRMSFKGNQDSFWAIVARKDGAHIGNISVALDTHNSLANISILVGNATARGKGFGKEAWEGVCDHLFRSRGVRKIQAGTMAVNAPMVALARSVGMVEDGRRIRHYVWRGREVDLVFFALYRDDWLAGHAAPTLSGGEERGRGEPEQLSENRG